MAAAAGLASRTAKELKRLAKSPPPGARVCAVVRAVLFVRVRVGIMTHTKQYVGLRPPCNTQHTRRRRHQRVSQQRRQQQRRQPARADAGPARLALRPGPLHAQRLRAAQVGAEWAGGGL
jgi:hypothetical protein